MAWWCSTSHVPLRNPRDCRPRGRRRLGLLPLSPGHETEVSDLDEFGLTDEQKLIRRNVAELLARVLPAEEIRRLDAASEFPHAAFKALAEAGYMALPYDPAYGGMGGSRKDLVVLVEALARHYSGASSLYLPTVVYGGMHLQLTAGEHLRRR
ncbi:MAG: acyl-CoA dehydrogenase family protein, partial [Reyranella sp.]